MMLGLLFAMSDFSTSMIAFSTVGAFLVFAITDVTLGSRRVHITRKMLMAVADSSIYTIAVCITVPSVLAVLRGAGTDVVMMAILLGGAASCLIQQMRRLASKLRGRSEMKSRFQLRLVTLLTTTLLATRHVL